MRVFLRHWATGLYYAGHKHWAGSRSWALDLGSIEHAAEASREEAFENLEILVPSDDPTCELVLPLKPRGDKGRQA